MKISIDIKSFLTGFLLAVVAVLVMGQANSGAGKSDFAIATERSSLALVRAEDGTLYVIDPQRAKAEFIEYEEGPYKRLPFNLKRAAGREVAGVK